MANRLINETSPYLLQHAHNPVEWFPWGSEALEKAKNENKPILVSIGYSACHWCHVMERESFEDHETAALMNRHFVNIKIDREERPDLDHIYMDAVQTMTGSGGWPLNVFLTPDAKPFYGGTYFPPRRGFNRPSWKEVLTSLSNTFEEKRGDIDSQAEQLTQHLMQSDVLPFGKQSENQSSFSSDAIDAAIKTLTGQADKAWGGFGSAPKFPQTFSIQLLLRYYHAGGSQEARALACLCLDKMIAGGIYDQLGGGFARYSTDEQWLVPHFEKMLYDNALLIIVLSEAYQATKSGRYREVIDETIVFVERELMSKDFGFYSALDADSEGQEGKYYIWRFDEVRDLLGSEAEMFSAYYDISPGGNLPAHEQYWQGQNILRAKEPIDEFAKERDIQTPALRAILTKGRSRLLKERERRIRPGLDSKLLLGWNALMIKALCKAAEATGQQRYRELAVANAQYLVDHYKRPGDEHFCHMPATITGQFAFLDDYAYLIDALMQLQEITGERRWLEEARLATEYVLKNFSDPQSGFFFFTDIRQEDVIFRKKEIFDGATPSGNATMAYNLYRLSLIFNIPDWKIRAETMVTAVATVATRHPTSFGVWCSLLMEMVNGTAEIAVVGRNAAELGEQLLAEYLPHKVLMWAPEADNSYPLLADKKSAEKGLIYVCKHYSCQKPVLGVNEAVAILRDGNKN